MIATLRRRHRTLVTLGALVATGVLFVALAARPPPVRDTTLLSLRNNLSADAVLVGENAVRVGAAALRIALFQTQDESLRWLLRLGPVLNRQSPGPDVLVYWQRERATDGLSGDARLLGPLQADRAGLMPLSVTAPTGQIVFYSLAHQRVLVSYDLTQLTAE